MKTIKEIKQYCYGCPSAWEGKTNEDEEVYIRFRYSYLRLDINNETVFGIQYSDDLDSVISLGDALDKLKDYIHLSPKAMEKYYEY